MSRFIFIYESEGDDVKEFIVKDDATTEEVLEAFAHFFVLCGKAYDDETLN